MANRYVRAAGGNYNAAGTWELTPGGGETVLVPTANDDVFLVVGSGQLTITATAVAKSFNCTGYSGILTHNTGIIFSVSGSITFSSTMTYTLGSGTAPELRMNASGTLTTNTKLMPVVRISLGTCTLGSNLTFYNSANAVLDLLVSSAILDLGGYTVSGYSSGTARLLIRTNTLGTAQTISVNGGTFANVDFRDITFNNGGNDLDLSAITGNSGDCGGNTNSTAGKIVTFTTGETQNWVNTSGGSWSTDANWVGSGGNNRAPLPQDDVTFICVFTSGQTVTTDRTRLGKTIDLSGATWSGTATIFQLSQLGSFFYGGIILNATANITYSFSMNAKGRNTTFYIDLKGKSWGNNVTLDIYGVGATYKLLSAWTGGTGNSFIRVFNGTFDADIYNYSATRFYASGTTTRGLSMGSGTWTITNTSVQNMWDITTATNLTFDKGTGTIVLAGISASNLRTFLGGGLTYNNITISGGGAGGILIGDSNAFATMTLINTNTLTLKFTAGTTQTVSDFISTGTALLPITILSGLAGSPFYLSKSSGIISCDYMSIKDSYAIGGAAWYAGANSTDVSGNSGWIFTALPAYRPYVINSIFTKTLIKNSILSDKKTIYESLQV